MSDGRPPMDEQMSAGTQSVVQILHYLFWGLRLLMVLLVVAFVFSGVFVVSSAEHCLLFRFGRLVDVKTDSRPYFAWPKPIEHHEKINVKKQLGFECGDFWYEEQKQTALSDPSQQAPEPQEDPLEPGKGGYVLTCDYNILHTKWKVDYEIADAKAYYSNYAVWSQTTEKGEAKTIAEAEKALQFALRNAVLKQASQTSIHDAFNESSQESSFSEQVARRFREIVADMDIGVTIKNVNYVQKAMPRSTRAAFDEATNAANKKSAKINEAEGYRQQKLREAEGEAAQIMAEAEAYKQRIINSVAADAKYLKEIQDEYEKSGEAVLLTRYEEVLNRVVNNAEQVMVVYPDQEIRITIEPQPPKKKPEAPANRHQPGH